MWLLLCHLFISQYEIIKVCRWGMTFTLHIAYILSILWFERIIYIVWTQCLRCIRCFWSFPGLVGMRKCEALSIVLLKYSMSSASHVLTLPFSYLFHRGWKYWEMLDIFLGVGARSSIGIQWTAFRILIDWMIQSSF